MGRIFIHWCPAVPFTTTYNQSDFMHYISVLYWCTAHLPSQKPFYVSFICMDISSPPPLCISHSLDSMHKHRSGHERLSHSLSSSLCLLSVRMIRWSSILSRAVCLYQCLRWCKHTFFVEWTIDVVRWTHASDHFACWIRTHQDLTFQDLTIYLLTFGEFLFLEK